MKLAGAEEAHRLRAGKGEEPKNASVHTQMEKVKAHDCVLGNGRGVLSADLVHAVPLATKDLVSGSLPEGEVMVTACSYRCSREASCESDGCSREDDEGSSEVHCVVKRGGWCGMDSGG
jgi:hypothetical protein